LVQVHVDEVIHVDAGASNLSSSDVLSVTLAFATDINNEMYAAAAGHHGSRQRRVTLHHSSREPDTRDARPASYRHLYQIRRFNGDIIAQVIYHLLQCCVESLLWSTSCF